MHFSANGKLMLFGEYLVMHGSNCIAMPLKFHQKAEIVSTNSDDINWNSFENKKRWFNCRFSMDFQILESSDEQKAQTIQDLLQFIAKKKPALFQAGLEITISSNFPRKWGLGSSSSLISLLSQWSKVNPYELLSESFGGSGYDVACATEETPIVYQINNRNIRPISLHNSVVSKLLFVYSGQKQSSKNELSRFNTLEIPKFAVDEMNRIIADAEQSVHIMEMENCMQQSEILLENILQKQKLKDGFFADYPFSIKSLGAWGGDFFMASYRDEMEARQYFTQKGFSTHFNYSEIKYH